jgi:3-isopropylmalate dehydrogenase
MRPPEKKPAVKLVVLPGEGSGPEVTVEGVRIAQTVQTLFEIPLQIETYEVGEIAMQKTGSVFPADAVAACDQASKSSQGAILFGAVSDEPIGILRKKYDLFANLRPLRILKPLIPISPLKQQLAESIDMLIVRELVSDVYYGESNSGRTQEGRWASQQMFYSETEVRRIVRVALECAQSRRKDLVLVHKGNVIKEIFAIWRDVLSTESCAFPEVRCREILVDTMAMQMVRQPFDFDVILCSNLFGDILSDLGAGVLGSLGLLPSASRNEDGFALYEPVGGTAPDIAGRNVANPVASILSVALWCRYTLHNETAAQLIERAVEDVLVTHRTPDILAAGCELVSTQEMGKLVSQKMIELTAEIQSHRVRSSLC